MTMAIEDGGDKRPATPYDFHRLDSLRSSDGTPQSYTATTVEGVGPGPAPTAPPPPVPYSSFPTPPSDHHHNNNTRQSAVADHNSHYNHDQNYTHNTQPATVAPDYSPNNNYNHNNHNQNQNHQTHKILTPSASPPRLNKAGSRPLTPPNRGVPAFQSTYDELKRDSGIDNSTTTDNYSAPVCQSPLSNTTRVLTGSPSHPSIFVQDAAPPKTGRSNRGFLRKFSREVDRSTSVAQAEEESAVQSHKRLRSFHGIDMDIPSTTGLEDLNQPEKLKFSNRGSVLLNGQKLDAVIAGQTDGMDVMKEEDALPSPPQSQTNTPLKDSGFQSQANTPAKGPGLQTGRRTPSVHMLQAVMQGSRIMSAEELTFSQKVRTMYEFGDENAADWTTGGAAHDTSPSLRLEPSLDFSSRDDTMTPELDMPTSPMDNPRRRPQQTQNSDSRLSFIARNPNETAGGIEDWNEIPEGSVDRYGFINPSRVLSQDTSGARSLGLPESRPGMQRVSTSLQMLSNSPRQPRRRLFRGPSTLKRYSRSLPPSRAPSRQTFDSSGPASSIYSLRSNMSSTRVHNPFRSRDRRLLDEASDMLTLPAYLSPLTEATEKSNNPEADQIKRREWNREKKWFKMAHPISHSTYRGGGMKFDFDTSDPKLAERTWKGIPDRWRATAWHAFLSKSAEKRGNYPSDDTLIRMFAQYQEEGSADDVQIDVDVPRTISMHIMFRRRYRGGQRLLFRVLHAISLHFPTTGYVQGMAALAATLLCYYDEEMAFVMLVRLWQLRGLEELYKAGFAGLMAALDEFHTQWLGTGNDTSVYEKLQELGIDPTSYGTRWYLTLFNMSIPFPAQLRVWDVFMLLGDAPTLANGAATGSFAGADLSVLHAASSAIVEAMKTVLLESDFENGMKVLTSWVPVQDEDLLMKVAKTEYKMGIKNRRRDGRVMT